METIQQIEKILGIQLAKKSFGKLYDPNQKNTYSGGKESPKSLRLDDVRIDDFSKLLPHLKELRTLELKNSTIPNFSELLNLSCFDITLNNVVFQNNNCGTKGKVPGHLKLSNMKFDAAVLRCFKKTNIKGFVQVEFRKCHIDNIQHINDIVPLSLLILDEITFTHQPTATTKKETGRLSIYNSNFKDVSFLPFQDSLGNVEFENCKIGSIAGLTKFPKLKSISIDSDTIIKDKSVQKNDSNRKINCYFTQGKEPMDLRMVRSLSQYIHGLYFDNYKEKTINFIGEFKKINHLSFNKSKVYIDAFLPIAKQLKSISFTKSKIKRSNYFKYFKNLSRFEINNYDEENLGLRSFEKILPLKKQLKVLKICDFEKIKAPQLIKEFKALESLKIAYEIPVKTAKYILTLKNLKKLSLSVNYKKCSLSLEKLKKLEFLILEADINFTGFEQLKKLKSLKIGNSLSSTKMDINAFPKMENLKRLNYINYNQKIKGLKQFPNLEFLRLKGSPKIRLGKHDKLKVLDVENSSIKSFKGFKALPNLKRLDSSSLYNSFNLKGLHKFPNLKSLSLMESEVDDIAHLAPLKKLEYLDLSGTSISDIHILNTLPKLKGVNLATYSNENLEEQLDNPKIAVYCGRPSAYLWIWEKDEFGI